MQKNGIYVIIKKYDRKNKKPEGGKNGIISYNIYISIYSICFSIIFCNANEIIRYKSKRLLGLYISQPNVR